MKKFFAFIILFFYTVLPAFSASNLNWFKNFEDEKLFNLILSALNENKDIIVSKKKILYLKEERNKNISRLLPNINVGSDYTLIKLPKSAIPSTDIQTNSSALPFLMAWEIDYLGERVDKIKKAKLDIKNAQCDFISNQIIISSEIAAAYFNSANLIKQIELQQALINSFEIIYSKKLNLFKYGIISEFELNQAKADLLYEKNNLENLLIEKNKFLTEIAYLTGKSPKEAPEIKISPIDKINYKGKIYDSFSGDIILNRPDIIKLENEIKQAKIDITLAKKDFLPKINVFGAMVFSTIVQNFGWDGVFAGLAAGAFQNLFDGGRRIFTLKQKKAAYEIALETYLKADLIALKELNDALYTLKNDIKIYQNNENAYNLYNSNFIKVFNSYKAGEKSYIDYKNTNLELIQKEMVLLNSKNKKFIDLISLYKAAGGALE